MRTLLTFFVLLSIKAFGRLFYQIKVNWVGRDRHFFNSTRMILLLNHTSLFEPIYLAVLPISLIWKIAKYGVLPGADITMRRPVMGWFFKLVTPDTVSISRRLDKTWKDFLNRVDDKSIVLIAPEGRMKRSSGLDKSGQPMTVRGGVFDLLNKFQDGHLLIAYSGGLHHIMKPEDKLPKLFKKIRLTLEVLEIDSYKKSITAGKDLKLARLDLARDLEARRDRICSELEKELDASSLLVSYQPVK